jgi:hypothetical protein
MESQKKVDAAPSALRCSPVRLYEFNAIVSYNVVVAATSEADARDAISSWEQAWPHNSEFQEVCHVDLVDERELGGQTKQWATDEANEVSIEAYKLLGDD